jgi:phosphate transport system protein
MNGGQQNTIDLEVALVEIDQRVLRLFAMVREGLSAATTAFLAGDCGVARKVVAADVMVDSLELAIEDLVHNRLVCAPTVAIDVLLPLVAILRIVPELERSGDLVEHIALRTPQRMAEQLSPRARGLILEMARSASTCGERRPTPMPSVISARPSVFGSWTTISTICT